LIVGLMFTALCAMLIGAFGRYDWFRWPDYLATGCLCAITGLSATIGYVGAIVCLILGTGKCDCGDEKEANRG